MDAQPRTARRLKLRHVAFLLLLLSGAIPLAITNWLLISQNRELLVTEEKSFLTSSAQSLSRELDEYLAGARRELEQVGVGTLAPPGPADVEERLRAPWVSDYLQRYVRGNSQPLALRVLDLTGSGWRFSLPGLGDSPERALDDAFTAAVSKQTAIYRFAVLPRTNEPVAALAVPVADGLGKVSMVVETVVRLRLMEAVLEREARGQAQVFLVDRDGKLLWSEGSTPAIQRALASSNLVRDFAKKPLSLTAEYTLDGDRGAVAMLGMVSPVVESGWGVVVHRPVSAAFESARRMVISALLATLLLLLLAVLFAIYASRWLGLPIRQLSETAHGIASGDFGERLPQEHVVTELADLSADFNRMAGYVQDHVAKLKEAARQNRELFISSIRAFAAAIDAKDPYTRGHSERVAELSRLIARSLGQNEEFQNKLWIGALLHDIGKIGIEDRILNKSGVLTPEEFELMKNHPVIGADILQPIEALHEMLPIVRWHHEAWNGKGYPDKLRGDAIPLMARIVAVADCFDAITTSRPYQTAYEPAYAAQLITQLAGSRFDAKVVTAFLRAFEGGSLMAEMNELSRPGLEIELPIAASI
ncbi:MAG: HD domain-containing phosphohydrolase [Thermoanaerobaculia bacterium]